VFAAYAHVCVVAQVVAVVRALVWAASALAVKVHMCGQQKVVAVYVHMCGEKRAVAV
jgi:hypothetical protein